MAEARGRVSGLLRTAPHVLVALVVALPICILVWPHLPLMPLPSVAGIGLDRLLLFLVVFAAVFFLLRKLPLLGYGVLVIVLAVVTFRAFQGGHGFRSLFDDYGKMRFFSTIELVNALEQEKAKGKTGQLAEGLTKLDLRPQGIDPPDQFLIFVHP